MLDGTEMEDATTEEVGTEGFDPGDEDIFAALENELNGADDDEVSVEGSEDEGADDTSEDAGSDGETYTVKVDGQEIEVTRDELLAGYSRQQDYTRKTQELAQQRERLAGLEQLAEALNTNPEVALRELAEAFNVEMGTQGVEEPAEVPNYDDMDPLEREIAELKAELRQVKSGWESQQQMTAAERQRQEAEAALDAELAQVRTQFNVSDLDEDSLLQFAVDNQIHNLSVAYELMQVRNGGTQQEQEVTEQEQPNAALERKRQAPPVEGGSTRKGARSGGSKIESIDDALRAALDELKNG